MYGQYHGTLKCWQVLKFQGGCTRRLFTSFTKLWLSNDNTVNPLINVKYF